MTDLLKNTINEPHGKYCQGVCQMHSSRQNNVRSLQYLNIKHLTQTEATFSLYDSFSLEFLELKGMTSK